MFSYEIGIYVGLFLWLSWLVHVLFVVSSVYEKNLNKIGYGLDLMTLEPKLIHAKDAQQSFKQRTFSFLFFALVVGVFTSLSWLFVLMFLSSLMRKYLKTSKDAKDIIDFKKKLRRVEMTFDQLICGFIILSNNGFIDFETYKNEVLDGMKQRGFNTL
ncbi:MAG: hypothetical protein Q7K26_01290 [bacterium]|nr:hypothetical protein [bacterium]